MEHRGDRVRFTMKALTHWLWLALALRLAPGAAAQSLTFTIDPGASTVGFSLSATMHRVEGTFRLQPGTVQFDRSTAVMSGSVAVAAGSGTSGNQSRDRTMKSRILLVDRFAEVTFSPSSYRGTIGAVGDSTIQVSGEFTLLGMAHDLTVPVRIHVEGADLTARTGFTVPYVKWGLEDPSVFLLRVAKEVEIEVTLAGKVAPSD